MNELILFAIAQAQDGGGTAPPMGCAGNPLLMMVVVFAIFYFLVIRPQQKQLKEHRNKLSRLKKGDEVVTNGGLIGTITALTDDVLTLQVDEKVRVRVLRTQIASVRKETAAPEVSLEKGK